MQTNTDQLVKAVEDMDFAEFMQMKSQWLVNLYPEWLITGHLTSEEAVEMVDVAEKALNFNRISKEEVELRRCIRLDTKTVYSHETKNKSEKNPNSCVCVTFSADCLLITRDKHAQHLILIGLIKETLYN